MLDSTRQKQNLHQVQNRLILLASFASVFLLFSLATAVSTYHAWRSNEHTQAIANELNAKTLLINRMRNAARERSLELYAMTSLPDPFQRDDAYMQFKEFAADFIVLRRALLEKDLSQKERAILQRQADLTNRVYPIQERIVELVQNDQLDEARDIITRQAVPLQTNVLNVLNELMNIQLDTIG
ncbi:MAG: MCP four helix bundle domain-containing protein, partial [Proteobacteria bacterium]|nr:MCP four helix bundle domain-containing protein [Pseudomonadota bacterium]